MSIFKKKTFSYGERLKLQRRITRERRKWPGNLRIAGDFFRTHPALCRKAQA